ncbi:hypothetical protein Q7P37_004687 [Cladosporium fusiforme]
MATRRSKTKVEIPISTAANASYKPATNPGMTSIDTPAASPWLPTPLEAILLSLYPGTLLLGSLFSTLTVNDKLTPYIATLQSYAPDNAPSYFAKKSNVFNVYFVKIGWIWITAAFFLFVASHRSLGPSLQVTKRRVQAVARYACVTLMWIGVTQWFFGPALIDRGFRLTGGQCAVMLSNDPVSEAKKADMSDMREALSHAACKAAGGRWMGGHDISGHVFLLIVGSGMLWFELLPVVVNWTGLREARRINSSDGRVLSASTETTADVQAGKGNVEVPRHLGVGVKLALGVAVLSWWMLLMTAAYFHTWFEKFTGFVVASTALYAVYFLPRAISALRQAIGMPGA